jgi:nuclear transport factor 2 (NTF2) superfamily protein
MNETENKTDFLLPRTSFWKGFGSVLSVEGNQLKFNTSKSDAEADYKAIKSDWDMVGNDFDTVIAEYFK